jgi:iron complex outermembrane recepter protein
MSLSLRHLGRVIAPLVLSTLALAAAGSADDAFEVAGIVRDETGRPVGGVSLAPADGGPSAETDSSGAFRLSLAPGRHTLRVTAPGRAPASVSVDAAAARTPLEIALGPLRLKEDVVVQAIRAEALTPVTKTDLRREDIERLDYGQEMPVLLKQTPSLTQYSETGVGAGYAYFYLRGIQQTRVNMTLDGVPLNEAEDSTLYFVDFDGLAGSLDSIQVQRGVGTSSVGSAAFAGSVNFESIALVDRREMTALVSAGSFGTYRTAVGGQTGRVGPGLGFYGRLVFGGTDGFREHSGVDQHTVFFGARRQGDRSTFKLFGFSGREKTELAFLAVDRDTLEADLRANPLSPVERDRFGQDLVQAQWTRVVSASSTLALQGYYNGAQGYYRLLDDPVAGPLSQYDLDWRFVGAFVTFNHESGGLGITGGVHLNDFASHHSRDVVDGAHLYTNQGFKREASGFAKIHYDRAGLRLYGDAQVRHSSFRYEGNLDIGSADWTFFNPKLGARYSLRPSLSVYASLGRTTREPTRSDLFTGEDNPTVVYDLHAVRPERVVDYEAGVEYSGPGLRLKANAYAMELRNEIALTGELSDIGLPLRRNVDRSHRRGVELEVRYEPRRALRLTATANASANRIATWNQSFDVYEADGSYSGSELRTYHDVRPLLTPQFIGNLGADYTPIAAVTVGLAGRYVSTSQLDNTDDPALATPSFFDMSAQASVSLARWVKKGEPRLRVLVSNLLGGRRHWPSGYSYLYVTRDDAGVDTLQGTPYYYPLATRSVFVNLDVRF